MSENATPWPPGLPIRGISWNCLWISVYMVAIPGTYGKSVLAAITAASMAPFGLLVATEVNRNPIPTGSQLLLLLIPPFAAAAWTIPAARHLHRLGAQVTKAQAMGSYELLDLLGRGGMGEVWRARHRMLARDSAIKLIRPEVLSMGGRDEREVVLRRFEREARATAALRSPHTVDLYDYGVADDGSFYYVMELLDGLDLETLVHNFGPQPAGRVVCFLSQAAKSLAEAHEASLVHRDIKPRNIFTCRMGTDLDFIKVLDFGLVKISSPEAHTQLTREDVTTGTPAYMAPEVAMGRPSVDGRADLYSLACVGYWLLTGQLVFDATNAMAMALAHVQTPPTPPSRRTELDIPEALEHLILRCLEKEPGRRPSTARELASLLSACQDVAPWTPRDAELWWCAHLPRKGESPTGTAAVEVSTRA
jgi:eukaryotic-like serine/threonine-protein kinase